MEHHGVRHYMGNLTVEVKTPTSKFQQLPQTLSSVEEISLKFRVQIKCVHFQVAQNNTITSSMRHRFRELPFAIHRLPIDIFEQEDRGDQNGPLQQYLSLKFANYRGCCINTQNVADAIKGKWVEIREKGNSNVFGKLYPLTVTLKLWHSVIIYVRQLEDEIITPTRNDVVENMLKKAKFEEIGIDQSCVICLEEIVKKSSIVQTPCLHVFHETCIKNWLENNESCPICRFQMPTN